MWVYLNEKKSDKSVIFICWDTNSSKCKGMDCENIMK